MGVAAGERPGAGGDGGDHAHQARLLLPARTPSRICSPGGGRRAIPHTPACAGCSLQVHGSGALTRWLLENDLVDEMNLLIVPVVVGQAHGCSPPPART